jgi:hypothetical protein
MLATLPHFPHRGRGPMQSNSGPEQKFWQISLADLERQKSFAWDRRNPDVFGADQQWGPTRPDDYPADMN